MKGWNYQVFIKFVIANFEFFSDSFIKPCEKPTISVLKVIL